MGVIYSVPKQSFQPLLPLKVSNGNLALKIVTVTSWELGPKIIADPKKFRVKKNLGKEKFIVQEKCCNQKILDPKRFKIKQILGPKKVWVLKILGPKKLGPKKFMSKKISCPKNIK